MPVIDRYDHPAIYITLACVSVVTLVVLSLLILQYLKYGCEACLNSCNTSEQVIVCVIIIKLNMELCL